MRELKNKFYVYELRYPSGNPFYVGKGSGKRIESHERAVRKGGHGNKHLQRIIREIWDSGKQVEKRIIARYSNPRDALNKEEEVTRLYQRRGIELANLQIGGSYYDYSKIKERHSLALKNAWRNREIRERFMKGQKGCKKPPRTVIHQKRLDVSRQKPMPDRDSLFNFYILQEKSREYLSQIYKVDSQTILRWLKFYGIKIRNRSEINRISHLGRNYGYCDR